MLRHGSIVPMGFFFWKPPGLISLAGVQNHLPACTCHLCDGLMKHPGARKVPKAT